MPSQRQSKSLRGLTNAGRTNDESRFALSLIHRQQERKPASFVGIALYPDLAAVRLDGARREATICQQTGLSKGTAQRALHSLPKNHLQCVSATAAELPVR